MGGPLVSPLIRAAVAAVICLSAGGCALFPWLQPAAPAEPPVAESVVPVAEADALAWVNSYRAGFGLGPVALDPALTRIAQKQAAAMAAADLMSHSVGGSLSERLADYPILWAVENIAAGQKTLPVVLEAWRASPHHDENLRDAHVTAMGIAAAANPEGRYGHGLFWAMVLAQPTPRTR